MGFAWTPGNGNLDAGIDGLIEIRNHVTGEMTNNVVQVQSRATERRWTAETATEFEYLCDQRDLDYWMEGNAPVILVCSRPSSDEAYFVSVKDYFRDAAMRASRRIRFDKTRDRFSIEARQTLIDIAVPRERGLYFAPPPKQEHLVLNLLPVVRVPQTLYLAETPMHAGQIHATLRAAGGHVNEWFLRAGRVLAAVDLREAPWEEICDQATVEVFDAGEWAQSQDPVRQAEYAELLYACLASKVEAGMRFNRRTKLLHMRPGKHLAERHLGGVDGRRGRSVFKAYAAKSDATQTAYCRHSGFEAHFARYEDTWYLSIAPTYHFTADGQFPSSRGGEFLSNAKRRERNDAVRQQVEMWARYLTGVADDPAPDHPFLAVGQPVIVELDAGIDDKTWLADVQREDDSEQSAPGAVEEAA